MPSSSPWYTYGVPRCRCSSVPSVLADGRAAVAPAGDDPRLVVVVPVEAVPADVGQAGLPAAEAGLEVAQVAAGACPTWSRPWSSPTCSNWNTMSISARAGSVNSLASSTVTPGISPTGQQRRRRPAKTCDASRCRNSWIRGPSMKYADAVAVRDAVPQDRAVRQRGVLGDHVDDVHPEAVDAPVEPPAHHRVDRLADLGVLPVEVGLLAGEQVQVVLAGRLVELPGRTGEERAPSWSARRRARRASCRSAAAATSTSRGAGCPGTSVTRRTTGARPRCG